MTRSGIALSPVAEEQAAISAKHTAEMMTREAAAMQSRAMEEERAARREAGAMKAELEVGRNDRG